MAVPNLDNFPFGTFNAAEKVTSLTLLVPENHYPTDPVLPPNPIFELSPAASVIDALDFQLPGLGDGLSNDWLLG
jgi:hypothetical protein